MNAGPAPTAFTPPGETNALAGFSVPGLTTGVIQVTADRDFQLPVGSLFADASVNDVTVSSSNAPLPTSSTIVADQVRAHCESPESPLGFATIVNGSISVLGGAPVSLPPAPAPNTVAVNLSTLRVILNEQVIASDGELTVNAMHIQELVAGIVGKDIIIAQTRCGLNTGLPLAEPPEVTTDPATSVTSNSAALNVTIDAGGSPTTYKYEYGPTTAFGTSVPASGTLDAGSEFGPVSQPPQSISGLSPGTTYYFRACANNAESGAGTANQVCGAVRAFTTSGTSAPSAVTGAASSITATGASVAGTVNAHGQATAYTIEYGTTTSFGSITAPQSAGSGTAGLAVTVPMGGLSPGTTYYYRLVATNATGTTVGAMMSFTTVPAAPTVVTGAASAVTSTGATLSGTLNPRNGTTTFTFEYGTNTSLGHITAVDRVPATPAVSRTVSLPVTGLTPATTYLYRLVATNANGTTTGAVMSFKTAP